MVGSHLAEHFAGRGDRVVALDNLSRLRYLGYKTRRNYLAWDALRQCRGITRMIGDVRRPVDLKRVFAQGTDLVIHAAGQVGVSESLRHPSLDCQINILGTLQVLEAVRKWAPGATVIFCSTNKVYGNTVNNIPVQVKPSRYVWKEIRGIPEDWPVDRTGHTPYGVSKLAADLYVQEYGYSFGIRTVVFRMSCIYGERQLGMVDQGWVAWLAMAICKGWPITLYGTGKQVRDLLYVRDLARLCELYHDSSCPSEVFNVGGGPENAASVLEVVQRLESLLGKQARIRHAAERLHDQRVYISNIHRVCRKVGWNPKIRVEEGLRRLTVWVKENAGLFGDSR